MWTLRLSGIIVSYRGNSINYGTHAGRLALSEGDTTLTLIFGSDYEGFLLS